MRLTQEQQGWTLNPHILYKTQEQKSIRQKENHQYELKGDA